MVPALHSNPQFLWIYVPFAVACDGVHVCQVRFSTAELPPAQAIISAVGRTSGVPPMQSRARVPVVAAVAGPTARLEVAVVAFDSFDLDALEEPTPWLIAKTYQATRIAPTMNAALRVGRRTKWEVTRPPD